MLPYYSLSEYFPFFTVLSFLSFFFLQKRNETFPSQITSRRKTSTTRTRRKTVNYIFVIIFIASKLHSLGNKTQRHPVWLSLFPHSCRWHKRHRDRFSLWRLC
jgi:hypothetical protein